MGKLEIKPVQILFLMFFIITFAFGSGCFRSFEEKSYYNIRDMKISANSIGTAFADLNVTTCIEKRRKHSKKYVSSP